MPSSLSGSQSESQSIFGGHPQARPRITKPLVYSGTLDKYAHDDLTPAIGREYVNLQATELLAAEDAVITDLAVIVSQRGVVFLRDQDITPTQMKELMVRLSEQAGCPSSSTLHVHPLTEEGSALGDQISVISSAKQAKGGGLTHMQSDASRLASAGWHSDISFEPVPSDYAMLRVHTLPPTGGDTLWCSAYDAYDSLSPPMARMLEGLTATHDGIFLHDEARRLGQAIRAGERGSPLNSGHSLTAVHPVVRTNPVTGWKCLYVNRAFTKRLSSVTRDESDALLAYLFGLAPHNHDAHVRFRWRRRDLAIWDNRCTWHTATYDHAGPRAADRVCSLGEAPYLHPLSTGRKEALTMTACGE